MIALNEEEASWVVSVQGVVSQKIEKHTLNFKYKAWWTLSHYRLHLTTRGNVLNSIRAALISGFIAAYDFNVSEFLTQEIRDRVVGKEKLFLAYS